MRWSDETTSYNPLSRIWSIRLCLESIEISTTSLSSTTWEYLWDYSSSRLLRFLSVDILIHQPNSKPPLQQKLLFPSTAIQVREYNHYQQDPLYRLWQAEPPDPVITPQNLKPNLSPQKSYIRKSTRTRVTLYQPTLVDATDCIPSYITRFSEPRRLATIIQASSKKAYIQCHLWPTV